MQSKCLKFVHSLTHYVWVQVLYTKLGRQKWEFSSWKKDNRIICQTLNGVAQDQIKL